MIIANPIYDTVFKQLMENTKIATFIIQTLLSSGRDNNETIAELNVKPQELTVRNPEGLTLMRFDFVATIKNSIGEIKKVLIEIQKARNANDINRFRQYLALQYAKQDEVLTPKGIESTSLPIITIYLLGYKLPEWPEPAVKMGRFAEDLINHRIITTKCEFAEKLSHDSYYVQLPRIEPKFENRLEKLLNVFEQKYFIDKLGTVKDYPYPIEDDEIGAIVKQLNYTSSNPEEKKRLEDEAEVWRVFNTVLDGEREQDRALIEEQEKALEEKDKALEEKNKALDEKDKALEEKKREIEELKRMLGRN